MKLELRGERVLLRLLGPDDAGRVAAFHERNRAHLAPWSPPSPEGFESVAYWRTRLESDAAAAAAGSLLRLRVLDPADPGGDVLGHVSLSQIFRGPFQNAYLGYALDEKRQGQGLMTEALRLLIAHAFGPMSLHRIQANHLVENARSARVLERLGFHVDGVAEDYLFINGAWRTHVMTSILNREHPGP